MMNAKYRKLLLLALALLACSVMALGGTFASTINREGEPDSVSSEYKVTVNCYETDGYTSPLMTDAAFATDTLWCPGYTKIVYLAVTNNEKFPVECSLNMKVTENGFDSTLKYAVLAGDLKAEDADHPATWAEFAGGSSKTLTEGDNNVFTNIALNSEETAYYALAIHMDESATSVYQGKTLNMTFEFRVDANYAPGADPTK